MDPRLHQALDDDVARDGLTPALREELDATRALLDGVVNAIPTRPVPPLGASVLARIAAEERHETRLRLAPATANPKPGVAAWLWSPRQMSLSFRPAYMLAAAALVAVAAFGFGRATARDGASVVAAAATDRAPVLVEFRLDAPSAQSVKLAGEFSNWAPAYTMKQSARGTWTVVVPLTPGVHEYAFVVDGEQWTPDPAAPTTPDGFGGVNSRVSVLTPDVRS